MNFLEFAWTCHWGYRSSTDCSHRRSPDASWTSSRAPQKLCEWIEGVGCNAKATFIWNSDLTSTKLLGIELRRTFTTFGKFFFFFVFWWALQISALIILWLNVFTDFYFFIGLKTFSICTNPFSFFIFSFSSGNVSIELDIFCNVLLI